MTSPLKFKENDDAQTLAYWVREVKADALAEAVLKTRAFQRLYGVSFLGALDHIGLPHTPPAVPRSRAVHSINVAGLAAYIASKRKYSPELTRHLVAAALLHDVGHAPLSHSVEPVIKATLGIGHHEQGEIILKGRHPIGADLRARLSKCLDIDFVAQLIEGKVDSALGGDLFSSPINIDTIEGIIRSYRYIVGSTYTLNPIQVARASFLDNDQTRYRWLDKFWTLKGLVYTRFINNPLGLMADHYSRWYFNGGVAHLSEEDIFVNERQWIRGFTSLFENLKRILHKDSPPAALKGVAVRYTSRCYSINKQRQGTARYEQVKQPAVYRFGAPIEHHPAQPMLM